MLRLCRSKFWFFTVPGLFVVLGVGCAAPPVDQAGSSQPGDMNVSDMTEVSSQQGVPYTSEHTGEASMAVTPDDCKALDRKCMDDCFWNGAPNPGELRGDQWQRCDEMCTERFKECVRQAHEEEEAARRARENQRPANGAAQWAFDTMGAAMSWLANAGKAVAGALVRVGSVVYVVVVTAAGTLALSLVAG